MNGIEALAEFYVAMAPRVFPERFPELTAPVELMDNGICPECSETAMNALPAHTPEGKR